MSDYSVIQEVQAVIDEITAYLAPLKSYEGYAVTLIYRYRGIKEEMYEAFLQHSDKKPITVVFLCEGDKLVFPGTECIYEKRTLTDPS